MVLSNASAFVFDKVAYLSDCNGINKKDYKRSSKFKIFNN